MAKQQRILTGQVAAITGAARGIGRATAQAFLREGMKVAIGDLDFATAQKTAAELGHGTVAFQLDVTQRASVKDFLDGAEAQLGPVDVLINNAGIMQVGHTIWDEDDATTQRMIDINVNGVMFGVKEIVPRMLSRGRGHVVNIASTAGKGGFPGGGTYCGTKHYVVGLSEVAARRAARHRHRGLLRHARRRQHRAGFGAAEHARRQADPARGRGQRDRLGAEGGALRRLRPALGREHHQGA